MPNTPLAAGYAKSASGSPSHREVLFIGDSSVRTVFFSFAKLVGGKEAVGEGWAEAGEKHSDRKITVSNPASLDDGKSLTLEFWW